MARRRTLAWRWRFSVFSELEIVAVTSGEAKDPTTALPKALRWTLGRIGLFYVGGLASSSESCRGIKSVWEKARSFACFETVGIPAAAASDEFRRAHRRAFQRQLQSLSDGPNVVLAVERRLRTVGARATEQARNTGCGADRIQRGNVRGAFSWTTGFTRKRTSICLARHSWVESLYGK